MINLEIMRYKLKQGTYQVQFILNYTGEMMTSGLKPGFSFEVIANPQLFSVYPRNFIFLNSIKNQHTIYLVGRAFSNLQVVAGRLKCVLKFETTYYSDIK